MSPDPYIHAPQLRGRIADPQASFFRTFQPGDFDAALLAAGRPADWRYTDADREARRQAALSGRLQSDIWVFAYGSLMWDPAFVFAEVRRGRIAGYARRFCLSETYARGTRESCRHGWITARIARGWCSASRLLWRTLRLKSCGGAKGSDRPIRRSSRRL